MHVTVVCGRQEKVTFKNIMNAHTSKWNINLSTTSSGDQPLSIVNKCVKYNVLIHITYPSKYYIISD